MCVFNSVVIVKVAIVNVMHSAIVHSLTHTRYVYRSFFVILILLCLQNLFLFILSFLVSSLSFFPTLYYLTSVIVIVVLVPSFSFPLFSSFVSLSFVSTISSLVLLRSLLTTFIMYD